jgi:hypothetical protein
VAQDCRHLPRVVDLPILRHKMERVRQVSPRLVDVYLGRVGSGLRRTVRVVTVQTCPSALLPRDAMPHFLMQECVEILRCENSLTFFPRVAEGAFDDSGRGHCRIVELGFRFGGELVEVRPEVLLE